MLHPELIAMQQRAANSPEARAEREADDLMSRRRRNELLLWWKATALEAAEQRRREEASQARSDTSRQEVLASIDALLAAADKALLQARTGHAGKMSKVEQATRQVAEAREVASAAGISERDEALHNMQARAEEVLEWARLVEKAQRHKAKAEHALSAKQWEAVVAEAEEAIEAFEAAGEMDQVYAMDDLKQRAAQAKARAHHMQLADAALARGKEALKNGEVSDAKKEAQVSTDEFAKAAAGMPKELKALLHGISEAVAAAEAQAAAARAALLREQGMQAVEDAEASIQDGEFDDARLAIGKARSFFEQAKCFDEMSQVLSSLDAMVARGEGRDNCLKRARAAFEACKLGLERAAAEQEGKERRAVLTSARDECYNAIAGFQEAEEEDMAAQARRVLIDVDQRIRETNNSDEADAAIAAAERHLAELRLDEARRVAAQAMLLLAKGGLLEDREAQVADLEERIQKEEVRQRARQEARKALTAASTAIELSRLPGRAASLEEARSHLARAEQLLPEASDTELAQDVADAKHRLDVAAQWLQELEDGDAELEDARKHLSSGAWEEAHDCGETALQVFRRLDVAASIAAAEKLLADIASKRVRAKGEEELRKGEEALGEDDAVTAEAHARAAREVFSEAAAADGVMAAEELLRRIREARERDATVAEGSALLAQAEALMNAADFAGARRALSHARVAFLRAAVHDGEEEVREVEERLGVMEAAAAALREGRQAVEEAKQCLGNVPPDTVAAKFAAQRARAALERCREEVCAPCMHGDVRELSSHVQSVEEAIAALLDVQSVQETVSALLAKGRSCLVKEELEEAEEVLGRARQVLDKMENGGGESLQQAVEMQEELRVMREEVGHRQEGEKLLAEAEESLRAVQLNAAEAKAQQALAALNKAQKRLRVDALQQQTHRLILRIAEKIGKEAKKEHAQASLKAAQDCIDERSLEAARVHCEEARESLVKAGALQELEGEVRAVEARISQLQALDVLRRKAEQAVGMANTALDLVRVPGKRDGKLAEAKEHVASAETLHQAMLEVHPNTVASVVGEIVAAGQEVASVLDELQRRLAAEDEWARACVAGEEALALARQAHSEGELARALEHGNDARGHFSKADAREGMEAAEKLVALLVKDREQARAQV